MSTDALDDLRAKQDAARDERLRYLEHRVAVLERHREVLAVFLGGAWVVLTIAAVIWDFRL